MAQSCVGKRELLHWLGAQSIGRGIKSKELCSQSWRAKHNAMVPRKSLGCLAKGGLATELQVAPSNMVALGGGKKVY